MILRVDTLVVCQLMCRSSGESVIAAGSAVAIELGSQCVENRSAIVYWAVNVTRRAVTVKAVTDSLELNSAVGYGLAAVDAVAVACQN